MRGVPGWWLRDTAVSLVLAPLGWLFGAVATLRRRAYQRGWLPSQGLAVPVIVVGNIFLGGTGKTPLVAWLAGELQRRGWRPGIVCRGYGGAAVSRPRDVDAESRPEEVGDEPVLLARRTGVPVVVAADRVAAGRWLLDSGRCDILVLDDGLQHYRLRRTREILVMDGDRGLGNGRCLPAGPLREPSGRLATVDLVLVNGPAGEDTPGFEIEGALLRAADGSGRVCSLESLAGVRVHAVAGIGNPRRFFDQLERSGLRAVRHAFPDHHPYLPSDLSFSERYPVVMTEKDAVKCAGFADEDVWYLEVSARLNARAGKAVADLLDGIVTAPEEGQ